jgi:hypothetical protein
MGIPQVDANQQKINEINQEELQYAKEQAEVNYARNVGTFEAGMGIRDAGNAGVAAIDYLGDWQKCRDITERAHYAADHGLDAPDAYVPDLSQYASNPSDDNWQKVGDALNGKEPQEMQDTNDLMNGNLGKLPHT